MRGPYERLKYDFRRGWECPVCKRKEKTDFTVTFRHCSCGAKQEGGKPVVMNLVEDGVRRVWFPPKALQQASLAAPHVAEDAVIETVPESAASVPEAANGGIESPEGNSEQASDETPPAAPPVAE